MDDDLSLDISMQDIMKKRIEYGMTRETLASFAGIDKTYLAKIENGKKRASEKLIQNLNEILERHNPDNPLEILLDYVRIRFPTINVKWVIEHILHIKMKYMLHEEYAFYGYAEQYVLGDIIVMASLEEEKGTLLELKGKGCRQFEIYLSAQNRNWYIFFQQALDEGGVIKRIDLAINDRFGMLNIPELTNKCANEECISVFRSFKSYRSGELVRSQEQLKDEMGNTLYIGSLKSEVYFCIYEKDYEQYAKFDKAIEEAEVKNRFEIRMKNERATVALNDLLSHENAGKTAFGIINRYIRFVDEEEDKRRSDWKVNKEWAWFIGMEERKLKLTTEPEPYTFERTLNWLERQVAPTLKVVMKLDEVLKTNRANEIIKRAKLTDRHKKILDQQSASVSDIVHKGGDGM